MGNRFNIIGFGYDWDNARNPKQYIERRCCKMCLGIGLIKKKDEPGIEMCPHCGSEWKDPDYQGEAAELENALSKEAIADEIVTGRHRKQQARIISGRNRKKKYYDDSGNEITDPDLIADVKRGMHVIRYNEEKSGEDKPHIVRK